MLLCVVVFLFAFLDFGTPNGAISTREQLKKLASTTQQLLSSSAKPEEFVNIYQSLLDNTGAHLETFDASSELHSFAAKFGNIVEATKRSLQAAVSWTEEEVSKYAWNPLLSDENVSYINLRELQPDDPRLTEDEHYPFKIYKGHSGVHVPVEVYGGDQIVFHTLKWTSSLDYIFDQAVGLNFIYFASISGIMRVYPAFSWKYSGVDMFDIRRRSWYNQGSTVPKDILLLLDTSGSMTGQSLKVANVSAQKIVSNLDENDYVAVAHFPGLLDQEPIELVNANNESEPPCFKSFVRATKRNKMRLFHDLGSIKARGYARFDKALIAAFKLFENLSTGERLDRANMVCNQVLVVITDDALHFDDNLISALKEKPDNIRVLIYALGDPVSTIDEYEKKACPYRGHYMYLPAVGAVSNLIKDYHEKSTRISCGPNDSPLPADVVLHGAADLYQTAEYRGTGLMVSLSMPVYNRTNGSEFIGLMGTNLPVEQMVADLPTNKIGPRAYGFAVNANGYVVFHPTLLSEIQKKEEPPNFDWIDLEFNVFGDKVEIRKKLIDNEEGVQKVTDFIKITDGVHTYASPRNYAYARLPNTDFGISLVTPVETNVYFKVRNSDHMEVQELTDGSFTINGVPVIELFRIARVVVPRHVLDANRIPVLDEQLFRPLPTTKPSAHTTTTTTTTTKSTTTTTTTTTTPEPTTTTVEKEVVTKEATESVEFDFFSIFKDLGTRKLRNARSSTINLTSTLSSDVCDADKQGSASLSNSSSEIDCEITPGQMIPTPEPVSDSFTEMETDVVTKISDPDQITRTDVRPSIDQSENIAVNVTRAAPSTPARSTSPSPVGLQNDSTSPSSLADDNADEQLQVSVEVQDEFEVTSPTPLEDAVQTYPIENSSEPITDSASTIEAVSLFPELAPLTPTNRSTAKPTTTVKRKPTPFQQTYKRRAIAHSEGKYRPSLMTLQEFLRIARVQHRKNTERVRRVLFDLLSAEADAQRGQFTPQSPVRSKTISLNSGLTWTVPKQYEEDFEEDLTRSPVSSIHQRVFDAQGLLFWVPIQSGVHPPRNQHTAINQSQVTTPIVHTNLTVESETQVNGTNSPTLAPDEVADVEVEESEKSDKTTVEPEQMKEDAVPVKEEAEEEDDDDTAVEPPVTIFKALELTGGSASYKAGVIGITLEPDYMPKQLRSIPGCAEDSDKVCYFLEDGGFVVAVNHITFNKQIGLFLGHVDPPLMHALLQSKVFDYVKDYNFQATCYPITETAKTTSAASSPFSVSGRFVNRALVLGLGTCWLYGGDLRRMELSHTLALGLLLPIVGAEGGPSNQEPYTCIQLTRRYFATHNSIYPEHAKDAGKLFSGSIRCSETCERVWTIQNVVGTNLQLVITDPVCEECGNLDEEVPRSPVEDTGPDVCVEALHPRYRRQQDRCPPEAHPHDAVTCSSLGRVTASIILMVITLLGCVVCRWTV